LNGLIDRLAAKKGPTKPPAANEAEFKKIPEKSPEALELNYNKYNVKTKDGELGKITILHRYDDNIFISAANLIRNVIQSPCPGMPYSYASRINKGFLKK